MSEPLFIHLAVRTSFSLLESMITPKDLKAWAVGNGVPAVAVTDRNNLFGALEISETLSGAGVQPIMACCFDVTDGGHQEWLTQVSVYAQNDIGYKRLMELSSYAYLEAADGVPRLKREHLFEKTDGLILLTGGMRGEAAQYILKNKQADAEATLSSFADRSPWSFVDATSSSPCSFFVAGENGIDAPVAVAGVLAKPLPVGQKGTQPSRVAVATIWSLVASSLTSSARILDALRAAASPTSRSSCSFELANSRAAEFWVTAARTTSLSSRISSLACSRRIPRFETTLRAKSFVRIAA